MNKYRTLFTFLLIIKGLLGLALILVAGIGLGPDEAQYWTWSQHLDLGYYSKPPGIAWQIALGTLFWGNTELGVRFLSLILGTIIPCIIYALGLKCKLTERAAFWSALTFAFSPLGFLASFFAITDVGMLLFWAIACLALAAHASLIQVGFWIMLGALFKWPIYLLWIPILFFPKISKKGLITGFLISLLGLIPSLYWNIAHDWATFQHVFNTVQGGHGPKHGNILEFIGSQAALISPIFFLLMLVALIQLFRKRHQASLELKFCGFVTLLFFFSYLLASIFMKIQGNWGLFAYPTGFIVLGWYASEGIALKWLKAGLALAIVLLFCVFMIPTIQSQGLFGNIPISYRINPFKHNLGWTELEKVLTEVGYRPDQHILIGDKYQTTSILSFYSPGQKRAYFLNLHGNRKNQFSYWPSIPWGSSGYYVVTENEPHWKKDMDRLNEMEAELKPYFKEVRFVTAAPLFKSYGKAVKVAFIFFCSEFNGNEPKGSELY